MDAIARFSPLPTDGPRRIAWMPGMSLAAIARAADAPGWFFAHGVIRVNGKAFERALWAHIRPKTGTFVDLCVTIHGGKTGKLLLTLSTVALAVASAFVAPYLTPAIAGLGFSAAAAGAISSGILATVNIAAQMALRSLIAPPSRPASSQAQRELSMSGLGANALTPGETVPGVVGRMRVAPPVIAPWYVTLEKDRTYLHALVGVMGHNLQEDILLNGVDIDAVPDCTYEVFEGDGGESDTFLSATTYAQVRAGLELSNYKLGGVLDFYDKLDDQVTPANSYSEYHRFTKEADANEARFMILFEGGINRGGATSGTVPFRIRVKKLGEASWRNLPTFHIKDTKAAGPFRREIKIKWGVPGGGRWASRNDDYDCHVVSYRTGVGQPFEFLADPYFENVARTSQLPVMTAATTSGVTVSASSEFSGTEAAWKAGDSSTTSTPWRPTANSLPAWWKVDWGAGNTKNIRSINLRFAGTTTAGAAFVLEGSNDDATWAPLLSDRE